MSVIDTITGFIRANPEIIGLGEQAVEAAIGFAESAYAAHQAGVLTDDQVTAAWALVTAGATAAHDEVADAISAWRLRHPLGATGATGPA